MSVSHAFIGWCLIALSMWLFTTLGNAARVRGIAAKRFILDVLLVLLCGTLGTAIAVALLLKFDHWGWGSLVLLAGLVALIIAPFFIAGLYGAERLHHQSFRLKYAAASFLVSTTVTLFLAIIFFRLINGPDGGSTGGWEFGFIALFVLCPLLWAGLFAGLYLISISSTTREYINLSQP